MNEEKIREEVEAEIYLKRIISDDDIISLAIQKTSKVKDEENKDMVSWKEHERLMAELKAELKTANNLIESMESLIQKLKKE